LPGGSDADAAMASRSCAGFLTSSGIPLRRGGWRRLGHTLSAGRPRTARTSRSPSAKADAMTDGPRSYGSPGAFRTALTERLKNKAQTDRWTLPQLQRQIAYDRLLERPASTSSCPKHSPPQPSTGSSTTPTSSSPTASRPTDSPKQPPARG